METQMHVGNYKKIIEDQKLRIKRLEVSKFRFVTEIMEENLSNH